MRALLIFLASLSGLIAQPLSLEQIRAHASRIDDAIKVKSDAVGDTIFLRRAYLVIAGRIPALSETEAFLESKNPDKRIKLIELLSASRGHESHMFNFWADLLRLQSLKHGHGSGWHMYIKNFVHADVPYDDFVRKMLSASGHATENPAVGYYLRDRNMLLDNVSNTAQIFLGQQIGCAQCHDHPFDDITQLEYYELAAYFGGIKYSSLAANQMTKDVTRYLVKDKPALNKREMKKQQQRVKRDLRNFLQGLHRNEVHVTRKKLRLPHDYAYNDAKPNDVVNPTIKGVDATHVGFAKWATDRSHPFFTRVIVNRLWEQVFGQALHRPVDDWSRAPEKEEEAAIVSLEKAMHAADFRVRDFLRILYHTQLFQAGAINEETVNGAQISGPLLRRMSAAQLHDSLILLSKGANDEAQNDQLAQRWKGYQAYISELKQLSPEDIIARDELYDQKDAEIRKLRQEIRKIAVQIKSLREEGKRIEVKNLREKTNALRKKIKVLTQEGKFTPMMMSMKRLPQRGDKRGYRASEHPAPLKPGSFVRRFGGSDSQSPSSMHTKASIPQALSLMNGKEIVSATDRKSVFFEGLSNVKDTDARIQYTFRSLYSRDASEAELAACRELMQERDGAMKLARVILSSQSFLFIE